MSTAPESLTIRTVLVACLLACCCASGIAATRSMASLPHETVTDPTRNYLPGKYYERVALEALRHKDYASALTAYKNAAYWANKVAQYNLGKMYFYGMGNIPADRARGAAWYGIAAEEHEPDYDQALSRAYASLNPDERARAGRIWKKLQAVYGDKITLKRATRRFNGYYHSELAQSSTTEDDPTAYSIRISGYNPAAVSLNASQLVSQLSEISARDGGTTQTTFWNGLKQEFADFVATQYGRVDIEPIQPVSDRDDKPKP